MSQEDATSNGGTNGAGGARLRRPALERSEPRRGWGNLYSPGKADSAQPTTATDAREAETAPANAQPVGSGPADAAARVVRDGYRIVEENLRRGRQVAAELRGVQREVASFAGRLDSQGVVSNLAQTLIDPALTEQLLGAARGLLGVLSAAIPVPTPGAKPAAASTPPTASTSATTGATAPAGVTEPRVPLHPQERPDYAATLPRVLKLRAIGPGEWLADLEIDEKVRRVQIRAVDGEL
jgi:hypothetical protein